MRRLTAEPRECTLSGEVFPWGKRHTTDLLSDGIGCFGSITEPSMPAELQEDTTPSEQ